MRRENSIMDSEENQYLPLIIEKLKTIQPDKIILFGSYAYGVPDEHSDIDLLIVLNSETMPQNFQENMDNKLLVRNVLQELNKHVAIDLIVHTRPMYQKFNTMGSMFSRELLARGQVLYEAHNP
jgi:uncharacterized protein